MADNNENQSRIEYRKKRVKIIKRFIIIFCVVLLVLPTFLSIFLLVKTNSLQNQIDELLSKKVVQNDSRTKNDKTVAGDVDNKKTDKETKDTQETDKKAEKTEKTVINATQSPEPDGKKRVYLTFDDGPGVQTEKILDALKRYDVKATFFVNGKEDDYSKGIYSRIVQDGHTLGMHSYSHNYESIYGSMKDFSQDFAQIYNLLNKTTGVSPVFYRFPGGSTVSNISVPMNKMINFLDDKGITYLDWNVTSPDINKSDASKEEIINEIVSQVKKYDSSIVMMYDVADRPNTVKALPDIIKKLKSDNYLLLPVDESTPLIHLNK